MTNDELLQAMQGYPVGQAMRIHMNGGRPVTGTLDGVGIDQDGNRFITYYDSAFVDKKVPSRKIRSVEMISPEEVQPADQPNQPPRQTASPLAPMPPIPIPVNSQPQPAAVAPQPPAAAIQAPQQPVQAPPPNGHGMPLDQLLAAQQPQQSQLALPLVSPDRIELLLRMNSGQGTLGQMIGAWRTQASQTGFVVAVLPGTETPEVRAFAYDGEDVATSIEHAAAQYLTGTLALYEKLFAFVFMADGRVQGPANINIDIRVSLETGNEPPA